MFKAPDTSLPMRQLSGDGILAVAWFLFVAVSTGMTVKHAWTPEASTAFAAVVAFLLPTLALQTKECTQRRTPESDRHSNEGESEPEPDRHSSKGESEPEPEPEWHSDEGDVVGEVVGEPEPEWHSDVVGNVVGDVVGESGPEQHSDEGEQEPMVQVHVVKRNLPARHVVPAHPFVCSEKKVANRSSWKLPLKRRCC